MRPEYFFRPTSMERCPFCLDGDLKISDVHAVPDAQRDEVAVSYMAVCSSCGFQAERNGVEPLAMEDCLRTLVLEDVRRQADDPLPLRRRTAGC